MTEPVSHLPTWTVVAPSGYADDTQPAELAEIVEGCLILSDSLGVKAAYSPGSWRIVVRETAPKRAVNLCEHGRRWDGPCGPCGDQP